MFLHFLKKQKKAYLFRLSDEELISLYCKSKNGDLVAELFERYTHLVYAICLGYLHDREVCKDSVMEIFESLFEKLLTHEVNNFKNWLYSVTKNYCLMYLRKNAVSTKIKGILLEEMQREKEEEHNVSAYEIEMLRQADEQAVNNAVDQLNDEQHTCIHLLYHEEKSYREISDRTGYSIAEVKSYIQNGKRNLKNILINHYGGGK